MALDVRVALSDEDVAAHHRVRHEVFVREQGIFTGDDRDGWDDEPCPPRADTSLDRDLAARRAQEDRQARRAAAMDALCDQTGATPWDVITAAITTPSPTAQRELTDGRAP